VEKEEQELLMVPISLYKMIEQIEWETERLSRI
jgi:hypothetical protein